MKTHIKPFFAACPVRLLQHFVGFFFTIQFIAEKFVHTEYVILVLNCVSYRYHPHHHHTCGAQVD